MHRMIAGERIRVGFPFAWRDGLILVGIILGLSQCASAGIFLKSSAPSPLSDGLVSYTLNVVGTSGEIIHVASTPEIVPNGNSLGLHQVWAPIASVPTTTRQEQIDSAQLWSDAWRPYDSYFFFDDSNSLSVGGDFTETNNMTGGASLPSFGHGPPITGFGSYGHTGGHPAKGYILASRIPDSDVPFAQLVMRADDSVLVNLRVVTGQGQVRAFDEVCVGCPSIVGDLSLGNVTSGTPLLATLPVDPSTGEPLIWSLQHFVGPAGTIPGAFVNAKTGQFSWNPAGAAPGAYTAFINAQGVHQIYVGQLTFNIVPEPSNLTLLALVFAGSLSFRLRYALRSAPALHNSSRLHAKLEKRN